MFRGIRCSVNFLLLKKSLPEPLEALQHGPTALFCLLHSCRPSITLMSLITFSMSLWVYVFQNKFLLFQWVAKVDV